MSTATTSRPRNCDRDVAPLHYQGGWTGRHSQPLHGQAGWTCRHPGAATPFDVRKPGPSVRTPYVNRDDLAIQSSAVADVAVAGFRGRRRTVRAPKRLPPKSNLFNRGSLKPLIDTIGPKEPWDTRSRLPHVKRRGCAGMTTGPTSLVVERVPRWRQVRPAGSGTMPT